MAIPNNVHFLMRNWLDLLMSFCGIMDLSIKKEGATESRQSYREKWQTSPEIDGLNPYLKEIQKRIIAPVVPFRPCDKEVLTKFEASMGTLHSELKKISYDDKNMLNECLHLLEEVIHAIKAVDYEKKSAEVFEQTEVLVVLGQEVQERKPLYAYENQILLLARPMVSFTSSSSLKEVVQQSRVSSSQAQIVDQHQKTWEILTRQYYEALRNKHPLMKKLKEMGVEQFPVLKLQIGERVVGHSCDAAIYVNLRKLFENIDEKAPSIPYICASGTLDKESEHPFIFQDIEHEVDKLIAVFLAHPSTHMYVYTNREKHELEKEVLAWFDERFPNCEPANPAKELLKEFLKNIKTGFSENDPFAGGYEQFFLSGETSESWFDKIAEQVETERKEKESWQLLHQNQLGMVQHWIDQEPNEELAILLDATHAFHNGEFLQCIQLLKKYGIQNSFAQSAKDRLLFKDAMGLRLAVLYRLGLQEVFCDELRVFHNYIKSKKLPLSNEQKWFLYIAAQHYDIEFNPYQTMKEKPDKLEKFAQWRKSCLKAQEALLNDQKIALHFRQEHWIEVNTSRFQVKGDFQQFLHDFTWEKSQKTSLDYLVFCWFRSMLAGLLNSIGEAGKPYLQQLQDQDDPVFNIEEVDPVSRHAILYLKRIGRFSATQAVSGEAEAIFNLRNAILSRHQMMPDFEHSIIPLELLEAYHQWYVQIMEELEITTSAPPHYDFFVQVATNPDATTHEIALAEWLLDG